MDKLNFIVAEKPDPKDFEALRNGLLSHHAKNGHVRETDTYSVFVRDENGKTIAGVMVSFLWGGMEINSLWVDESLRGQGLGRKLMDMAEAEGIKRGCTVAYTNTFTWQAPEFYRKLGYSLYGEIKDFPEGNSLYYFSKKLT